MTAIAHHSKYPYLCIKELKTNMIDVTFTDTDNL